MKEWPGERSPSNNIAGDHASVGMQAQSVHGDVTIYQVPPGATPWQIYEIGLNHLKGGMPEKARSLINQAVEKGLLYDADIPSRSAVGFHWALAILSGRTLHQLTDQEFGLLQVALTTCDPCRSDRWTQGLQLIRLLLGAGQQKDLDLVDEKFEKLDDDLRDKILTHLELVLESQDQDRMWERSLQRAHDERFARDRVERLPLFFEPVPTPARAMPLRPLDIDALKALGTAFASLIATLSAWQLTGNAFRSDGPRAFFLLILTAVSGVYCARTNSELLFKRRLLRQKDLEMGVARALTYHATDGGFARGVERLVDKYFARYVPRNLERDQWLELTAGLRCRTRDTIAEAYRESAVQHRQIAWLARSRASSAERQWRTGTFHQYRVALKPNATTVLWCALTAFGTAIGVWNLFEQAHRNQPTSSTQAAVLLLISGVYAVKGWMTIDLERRRHRADTQEMRDLLEEDTQAYQRWKEKLARSPEDHEMADWLDCDRKILMAKTMDQCEMPPGGVIAHAFIEAPGQRCQRNRVPNGPWRYSQYRIVLFLLTEDGVRQVDALLDFGTGDMDIRQRRSYRFDVLSSAHITQTNEIPQHFTLTLVGGTAVDVPLRGQPSPEQDSLLDPNADEDAITRLSSDASGLQRTLYVLEGVTAEGKEWIQQEHRRDAHRVQLLQQHLDD